jgi:hypothetical protein
VAESEGFEPPIPVKVCRFSRPVPSTTRPTLRSGVALSITSFQQLRVDGCVLPEYANIESGPFAPRLPGPAVVTISLIVILSEVEGPRACPRRHKPRREFSHKLSRYYAHHFIALSNSAQTSLFRKRMRDLTVVPKSGLWSRDVFAVLPVSSDCLRKQNHADTREAGVDVFEKSFATQATINNSSKKQCQQCHRQRNQVITRYSSRPQACD